MKRRALLKAVIAAPVAGYVPTVSTWSGVQLALRMGFTTIKVSGAIVLPASAGFQRG